MVVPEAPKNLVGDNAYDSDKLDAELRQYGIEVIAPHRNNRKNKKRGGPITATARWTSSAPISSALEN